MMDKQKQLITEIMNEDAKDGLYKQQTAGEWLESEFYARGPIGQDVPFWLNGLFEAAKQMEREQIERAYNTGEDSGCSSTQGTGQLFIDGKDYYTQTYGQ